MQSGKLVQRTRRQEDLSAVVQVLPVRSRHHDQRVAAVVFIEAAGDVHHAGTAEVGVLEKGSHALFVFVVLGVRLEFRKLGLLVKYAGEIASSAPWLRKEAL